MPLVTPRLKVAFLLLLLLEPFLLCTVAGQACNQRCGSTCNRFAICHEISQTQLCVTAPYVAEHLAAGYTCGHCTSTVRNQEADSFKKFFFDHCLRLAIPVVGSKTIYEHEATKVGEQVYLAMPVVEDPADVLKNTLTVVSLVSKYNTVGMPFLPFARRYENHHWEVMAGPLADYLSIKCDRLYHRQTYCSTVLVNRNFANVDLSIYMIQVETVPAPPYSRWDKRSRLLEQGSFGPTNNELYRMPASPALWVRRQMHKDTGSTSHRQFYRERVNSPFGHPTQQGVVTRPCDAHTHYRRYAISNKDSSRTTGNLLEIKTSGRNKVLSVDGELRTVLKGVTILYINYREDFYFVKDGS